MNNEDIENISKCTDCGVRGTNWGQDCPNIIKNEENSNGEIIKSQKGCLSKNCYLYNISKCRPKLKV